LALGETNSVASALRRKSSAGIFSSGFSRKLLGDARQAELFDALLPDTHDYVIVVESIGRGYSRIKEVRPSLVVVFATIDDPGACQLLSMMTTDRDVMGIPIVTCMTWRDIDELDVMIDEIDPISRAPRSPPR
jgi:hypothetical protein